MTPLVLASTSVYRKQLLERLHLEFTTASPNVDETPLKGETPEQLVRRLAEAKARAVASQHHKALIIGSDQAVVLGERILGKPGNHENAVRQLSEMSGRRVIFLTGIALLNSATGHIQVDIVPYTVHFRTLTPAQIENYLRKEPAYQCAGSFKSEALGVALMERMEGDDPSALIGLPLIRLIRMLEAEGFNLL